MNKRLKYCLIGGCGVPCLVVICLIIGAYAIIEHFRYEHGLDYIGAKNKAHQSLQNGDFPEYVYWTKRVLFYTNDNRWTNLSEKLNEIAKAYELNNEQNQSQKVFIGGRWYNNE
ncbi:MAG: hypothetical protein FWH27_13440 [Planctomycetaceae bacterium]|nr:hypothetical protein [Planctomycetaceae bacterium]